MSENGAPYLSGVRLDPCRPGPLRRGSVTCSIQKIIIGELWATLGLWREFTEDAPAMCEDAEKFHEEANRRVMSVRSRRRGPAGAER